jgi:inner membrane protein YhjD
VASNVPRALLGVALTVSAAVAGLAQRRRPVVEPAPPAPPPPAPAVAPAPAPTGVGALVAKLDDLQRARPVTAVPFAVVKKFGDDQGGKLAALVAYYGFLSVFPLLLVLVSVLGFVLADRPDLQQDLLDTAFAQFPVLGTDLRDNVGEISGNGLALAVGLLGALWAGLSAMSACQDASNEAWGIHVSERPPFLKNRLRSLAGLLVLGALLVGTTALGSLGTAFGDLGAGVRLALIVAAVAADALVFLLAFQVLTGHHQLWRSLVPGALVAGGGYYLLQVVGAWYLERVVSGARDTYGTFAVVIGLLAWLYLLAQLAMYATELNVVLANRLWPRSLRAEAIGPADERAIASLAERQHRVPQERVEVAFDDVSAGDGGGGLPTTPPTP